MYLVAKGDGSGGQARPGQLKKLQFVWGSHKRNLCCRMWAPWSQNSGATLCCPPCPTTPTPLSFLRHPVMDMKARTLKMASAPVSISEQNYIYTGHWRGEKTHYWLLRGPVGVGPNLHFHHLPGTQIYTTHIDTKPKFTQHQIYTRPKFTRPQIYTTSNLQNPDLHKPRYTQP